MLVVKHLDRVTVVAWAANASGENGKALRLSDHGRRHFGPRRARVPLFPRVVLRVVHGDVVAAVEKRPVARPNGRALAYRAGQRRSNTPESGGGIVNIDGADVSARREPAGKDGQSAHRGGRHVHSGLRELGHAPGRGAVVVNVDDGRRRVPVLGPPAGEQQLALAHWPWIPCPRPMTPPSAVSGVISGLISGQHDGRGAALFPRLREPRHGPRRATAPRRRRAGVPHVDGVRLARVHVGAGLPAAEHGERAQAGAREERAALAHVKGGPGIAGSVVHVHPTRLVPPPQVGVAAREHEQVGLHGHAHAVRARHGELARVRRRRRRRVGEAREEEEEREESLQVKCHNL